MPRFKVFIEFVGAHTEEVEAQDIGEAKLKAVREFTQDDEAEINGDYVWVKGAVQLPKPLVLILNSEDHSALDSILNALEDGVSSHMYDEDAWRADVQRVRDRLNAAIVDREENVDENPAA